MAWSGWGVPSLAQTLPAKYHCQGRGNYADWLLIRCASYMAKQVQLLWDRLSMKNSVLWRHGINASTTKRRKFVDRGWWTNVCKGTVWVLSKLTQPEEPNEKAAHQWRTDGFSMAFLWNGPTGDWFDLLRPRSLTPGRPARRSVTPRRHECIWHLIESSCGMAWRDQITCFGSVVLVSDATVKPVRERHPWHQTAYIRR